MGFYATDTDEVRLENTSLARRSHLAKSVPPSKNRVWNFFTASETCAGVFESQPVESHQEKWPTPTPTVSGVHYYGLRYYMPESGRWASRDPVGERGGINIYAHVVNNSINRIDPVGLYGNPVPPVVTSPPPPSTPGPPSAGFGMPAISLDVSVGYAAQMCLPVGGAWGVVILGDVTISAGTCCGKSGIVGYQTTVASFGASLYAGVCVNNYGRKGMVSLGFSDSCPAADTGSWGGSFSVSGNASIATYGCTYTGGGGWSCTAGSDFSRATSSMVTIGGALTYTRTVL